MINEQTKDVIQRTYIENPDGFLDDYTIEDASRDIQFNEKKLKNAITTFFEDYPGFIGDPIVTNLQSDNKKLYFEDFACVDNFGNIFLYKKRESLFYDQFEENKKYYIVVNLQIHTTEETRENKNQNNKKYNFIIEESPKITFKERPEEWELILGTVIYNVNPINLEISASYSNIEKTKSILTLSVLFDLLTNLKQDLLSNYVNNKVWGSGKNPQGNIIFDSAVKIVPKPGELILPSLREDGFIFNDFINFLTGLLEASDKLIKNLILPIGNADFNTNLNQALQMNVNIFKEFSIWGKTQELNFVSFFGKFRLTETGDIVELQASENLRTFEQPEYSNIANVLFVYPSNNVDSLGNTAIFISNNFIGKTVSVFYKVTL